MSAGYRHWIDFVLKTRNQWERSDKLNSMHFTSDGLQHSDIRSGRYTVTLSKCLEPLRTETVKWWNWEILPRFRLTCRENWDENHQVHSVLLKKGFWFRPRKKDTSTVWMLPIFSVTSELMWNVLNYWICGHVFCLESTKYYYYF